MSDSILFEEKFMVNVIANLTSKLRDLPFGSVSTTISTYGSPVTSDTVARNVYSKLVTSSIIRIPLQWNNGNPCSAAGGGPRNVSADDWINTIIAMGAKPMIVLGGSADNNFSASDAANMVKRYKGKLYGIVIGNEPDNGGMSIADYINNIYKPSAQAIRAADPAVKIAGPAQASYKTADLQTFITQCKGLYDIVDYHHYGTGSNVADDSTLMNTASAYENEITAIRGWLNNAGQTQVEIQVGEFNMSWRFNDGVSGGDQRFFKSYNTAWSASAVGHILRAGGRGLAYSQQNGPLGIMVEPGNHDNGHPDGTPQPIYHGLGMFQGEGLFAGFGDAIMDSSSDNSTVDCFAGSSGNIVVVNKSSNSVQVNLTVKGGSDGTKALWSTNSSDPYGTPTQGSVTISGGTTNLTLAGYQVATVLSGVPTTPIITPPIITPPVITPPVITPPGTTPPASTVGLPVARNGTTGPVAIAVQHLLVLNGYTSQKLNGSYGVTTTKNVKAFQTKSNLTVTGVVEQTTYLALINGLV